LFCLLPFPFCFVLTSDKPPRRLIPQIPRDLKTIALKCLEKNPSARYASAEAMAGDLLG
jgi:hypothetical protein